MNFPFHLQKIIGHADYATTADIYIHKAISELIAEMAKLKKYLLCVNCGKTKKPLLKRASEAVFGGDNGARTRDLLTASQALSQLSYTPIHPA